MRFFSSKFVVTLGAGACALIPNCALSQDPPFIEPEFFSIRHATRCPGAADYSAEFRDTKGQVTVVGITGPSHKATRAEIGAINSFLKPYIGMRAIDIACDPRKLALITIDLFPRDISNGVVERVAIQWKDRGYELFPGTRPAH